VSDTVPVDAAAAATFERCIADGGLAVFPADTVYGLAADPDCEQAVARLNALKQRDPAQPSGVMFFSLADAEPLLAELGRATRTAAKCLLPSPVTLIVPNPGRRFPLACGSDPSRIGLRVPSFSGRLSPLASVSRPVLQSSANLHGGADPRRLDDVPALLQADADLVLDGGELPGIASTVVDLSGYEDGGGYEVLREGAVSRDTLAKRLDS
jgi:L-threonylcarbamoyladenylate synthase